MFELLDFMPEQGTTWAARVDWINNLITVISVFCTLAITGVMLYFAVKYRRRSEDQKTEFITHHATLETVWTVVPTIVVIYIFVYGFLVYKEMRVPPADSLEINVDAYRWRWDFTYPNGRKTTNDLVVPLGKPVRLIMTSHDVIHSFFIPAMRVKEDVYGGNYSYLWFTPTKLGEFRVFCAEYCGLQHSAMLAKLRVVTPEEYNDFVLERQDRGAPELPPAEAGKLLFTEKACHTCHTVDGTKLVGPSLKAIGQTKERPLADGSTVPVDENYLQESLLNPNAKVAAGFPPGLMPSFQGQLNEKQIRNLIAYLKTL